MSLLVLNVTELATHQKVSGSALTGYSQRCAPASSFGNVVSSFGLTIPQERFFAAYGSTTFEMASKTGVWCDYAKKEYFPPLNQLLSLLKPEVRIKF